MSVWLIIFCFVAGGALNVLDRNDHWLSPGSITNTLICAVMVYFGLWLLGIPYLIEMWPG